MDDQIKIEKLKEILLEQVLIEPQHVNLRHTDISEHFKMYSLRKYDDINTSVSGGKYGQVLPVLEKLKSKFGNKESFIENYENKKYYYFTDNFTFLSERFKYLHQDYEPSKIKKTVNKKLEEWKTLADQCGLDLNKHFEEIKKQSEVFNKIDDLFTMYQQAEMLLPTFKTIMNDLDNAKTYLALYPESTDNFEQEKEVLINLFLEKINNPDLLLFLDDNSTFQKFMESRGIFDAANIISKEFNHIYQVIMDSEKIEPLSMGEKFIRANKENTNKIENFISNKIELEDFENTEHKFMLDLGTSGKYNKVFYFPDHSLVIKDNKGVFHLAKDSIEGIDYTITIFDEYIDLLLKKKPFIANAFKDRLSKNYFDVNNAFIAINTFLNNESILKSSGFDIIDNLNKWYSFSSFETLDDKMNKNILDHKIKQYAHSITSSKYKHLYDENTYEIFGEIYNLKADTHTLQEMIGKKLAAYKTPEEFNKSLQSLLNGLNGFNMEAVQQKASNLNVNIISNEKNTLILEIKTFEQSSLLGSPSWCISRNPTYYDSYTENNNKQYFIYQFDKESTNIESMIGLTLKKDGMFMTSHLKNDDSYPENKISHLQLDIIKKSLKDFPNLNQSIKDDLVENSPSKKKKVLRLD